MSLIIRVDSNAAAVAARLKADLADIPGATKVAMNRVAFKVQSSIKEEMRTAFQAPTPYTLSGIQVEQANQYREYAKVKVADFAAKATPQIEWMDPQVRGGKRLAKKFEKALQRVGAMPQGYFAVPGQGAMMNQYGNMKPSQITQIMSYFQAFPEAGYRANMTEKTRKARGAVTDKQKVGFTYFYKSINGVMGVWQRLNFGGGSALKPILIFVKAANYRARLDFDRIAEDTARREFTSAMEWALRRFGKN